MLALSPSANIVDRHFRLVLTGHWPEFWSACFLAGAATLPRARAHRQQVYRGRAEDYDSNLGQSFRRHKALVATHRRLPRLAVKVARQFLQLERISVSVSGRNHDQGKIGGVTISLAGTSSFARVRGPPSHRSFAQPSCKRPVTCAVPANENTAIVKVVL